MTSAEYPVAGTHHTETYGDGSDIQDAISGAQEDLASFVIEQIANSAFNKFPLTDKIRALGSLGVNVHSLLEEALDGGRLTTRSVVNSEEFRATNAYKNFQLLRNTERGDADA